METLAYLLYIIPVKFLFACGFAFAIGALTVFYRDLVQLINILLMVWFFATPIVYSRQMVPIALQELLVFNPFSAYVDFYRFAILGQGQWSWNAYFITLGIAILIYILGRLLYRSKSRRFYQYL